MATTMLVHWIHLPKKPMKLICLFSDSKARCALAVVNKAFWSIAVKLIWEELHGVENILAVGTGHWPERLVEVEKDYFQAEALVSGLPKKTHFDRCKQLASLVKFIYVNNHNQATHWRGMDLSHWHILCNGKPLFPNLQALRTRNFLTTHHSIPQSTFLSLALSPSVTHLDITSEIGLSTFHLILSQAPDLTNLSINYIREPPEKGFLDILMGFKLLTCLTISYKLLGSSGLSALGNLPHLRSLGLDGSLHEYPPDWPSKKFLCVAFKHLYCLRIQRMPLPSIIHLLGLFSIKVKICCLEICLCLADSDKSVVVFLKHLKTFAPFLQSLRLHPVDRSLGSAKQIDPTAIPHMQSLGLHEVYLNGATIYIRDLGVDCWPMLRILNIVQHLGCPGFIKRVLDVCPQLRQLTVQVCSCKTATNRNCCGLIDHVAEARPTFTLRSSFAWKTLPVGAECDLSQTALKVLSRFISSLSIELILVDLTERVHRGMFHPLCRLLAEECTATAPNSHSGSSRIFSSGLRVCDRQHHQPDSHSEHVRLIQKWKA